MKNNFKKKKKGFTLIELIAVIAILAILAAIAIPNVISYVDKAKKTSIQTEAATVYNAGAAAYNDGNSTLTGSSSSSSSKSTTFGQVTVSEVVSAQTADKQPVLNNGQNAITMLGKDTTMSDLQALMNENVNKIQYTDKDGQVVATISSADSSK